MPAMFIVFVGFPIAIAYARRIWRRAGDIGTGISKAIMDRLERMDRNIDAIALEVERIGEAQRYLTKQQSIGPGSAEPVRQTDVDPQQVRR